jgi:hypothetical protein
MASLTFRRLERYFTERFETGTYARYDQFQCPPFPVSRSPFSKADQAGERPPYSFFQRETGNPSTLFLDSCSARRLEWCKSTALGL